MWKFLLLFCILVFNLRLHALNLVGSNKVVEKINLMNERAKGNIPFNDEVMQHFYSFSYSFNDLMKLIGS